MSYDDVEIEDMEWNEEVQAYTYPCPCGDLFQITKDDLRLGEEIARCPSCFLYITVTYNIEDFLDDKSKKKNIDPPKQQQPVAVAYNTNSRPTIKLKSVSSIPDVIEGVSLDQLVKWKVGYDSEAPR